MKQLHLYLILTICILLGQYSSTDTKPRSKSFFLETFQSKNWRDNWILSRSEKYSGEWEVKELGTKAGDKSLVVSSIARHHGIVTQFPKPFHTDDEDLVVQYEVRLTKNLDCGGAYLKLLTAESLPSDLEDFSDSTPYTIMFGPDKCGSDSKVHFIFRHKNPVSGKYEEKHMTQRPSIKNDKVTHLYTLHVQPDNSFAVYVDKEVVREGNLLKDFDPPVNPPEEIDDPDDKKPSDWVDDAEIPDPDAKKPVDWDEDAPVEITDPDAKKPDTWLDDEPTTIPDPDAVKPSDWNDELDGEWEPEYVPNPKCDTFGCGKWVPPTIKNPAYKGKWKPPMIKNPDFIGVWSPKKIPNPYYFEDHEPHRFEPMGALGFEIWTMTDGIAFDNIIITRDKSVADEFAEKTWRPKYEEEKRQDEIERKKSEAEEGFLSQVTRTFENAVNYLSNQNPLILGTSALLGILPFILICLRRGTRTKKVSTRSTDRQRSENATAGTADATAPEISSPNVSSPNVNEQKRKQKNKAAKVNH
eukprot:TRINITY_DN11704_c0_g1_i1.p1 TRINITY_DN11704_c0_g1~~TRINITY_DN11704_c0_g1_i1.p1  ORF type:complete len:557 (+),score=138.51 TRINITY_DN11704_c0_g1_i1:95-1672(+)